MTAHKLKLAAPICASRLLNCGVVSRERFGEELRGSMLVKWLMGGAGSNGHSTVVPAGLRSRSIEYS